MAALTTSTDSPVRPRAVTYASRLLYASAPLPIIYALIQLALRDDLARAAQRAYGDVDPAAGASAARQTVMFLPFSLVGVAVCVTLAIYVGRGKNPARILIWLWNAGVLFNNLAIIPSMFTSGYYAQKPAWFEPVHLTDWAIISIVLVSVSISGYT